MDVELSVTVVVIWTYFDTNLLIHALLPLFYLLLQLLEGRTVRCGAICLEDLDVPRDTVNAMFA